VAANEQQRRAKAEIARAWIARNMSISAAARRMGDIYLRRLAQA
jgi:hypothetical protein